jgi:hypothetical protein
MEVFGKEELKHCDEDIQSLYKLALISKENKAHENYFLIGLRCFLEQCAKVYD